MKAFLYSLFFCLIFITSCSSDSEDVAPENEVAGLQKIQTFENNSHLIELFTENGTLTEGYNEVFLRIGNKEGQDFFSNAEIHWQPIMQMQSMRHSAPKSEVSRQEGTQSLYAGYIVFPMAENETETWKLSIDYRLNEVGYSVTETIEVLPSQRQRVRVFKGTDGQNYILALVAPSEPKVGRNDMQIGLFKQEGMDYSVADAYTFKMDPRMPGMGNHSSPDNVAPMQGEAGHIYTGKLNLTMSGLWRINLQLYDEAGNPIKGEPVTDSLKQSSLYLELEF